ncbi:MAG: flagellar basal body rod protein FlgC [bacterium]|nr:flagellar basal body rod protein FlgC [bacterium]
MSLESVFDINGSGMNAQMLRLEVLSSNIANINATRTPEGGPYRRRDVVFRATPIKSFDEELSTASGNSQTGVGVEVIKVVEDQTPFLKKFDPGHPDAGPDGYVLFPNVNVVSEMVNVQEAARSYEANIAVIVSIKNMIAKTFEIGRR